MWKENYKISIYHHVICPNLNIVTVVVTTNWIGITAVANSPIQ